jgi:hypothetical protein
MRERGRIKRETVNGEEGERERGRKGKRKAIEQEVRKRGGERKYERENEKGITTE